jgi:hypothetical protein
MLPEYEEEFNPCPFYGVAHLAATKDFGDRARQFLMGGFDAAIKAGEDDMVSDRSFAALGRAIGMLRDTASVKPLLSAIEFAGDPEADYELNVAACGLAVQLSCLDVRGPVDAVEQLCAYLNDAYQGEGFAMKCQYALWILKGDGAGALAYLENPNHKRGLGWAATACADLHVTGALTQLRLLKSEVTNAVTCEAVLEAIVRLEEQHTAPKVDERLVWLHGLVSLAELMEGMDSDNTFEIRASLSTDDPVGRIYEIDDSSAADLK